MDVDGLNPTQLPIFNNDESGDSGSYSYNLLLTSLETKARQKKWDSHWRFRANCAKAERNFSTCDRKPQETDGVREWGVAPEIPKSQTNGEW